MTEAPGQAFAVGSAAQRIEARVFRRTDDAIPAVILCTGFGGTQDTPTIIAAARSFAAAGFAAITFDYRGFGASGGAPRQVVSVRRQLDDIRSVIRAVRAMPGIAAEHVALWGTSLGGGHVLTVAAEDRGIAAVVAQVPFNGFPRRVEGRSTRDSLRLLGAAVEDRLRGWLRLRPRYIRIVGSPRELAVMASEQASRAIEGLDSPTWRNQVAPRGLLEMMRYRPGRTVGQIDAPVLLCIAARDAEAQASTTASLATDARRGRQISYDADHFEIYHPRVRERVLRDQTEFLREALR